MNKVIFITLPETRYLLLIQDVFKNMFIDSNQQTFTSKMSYAIYYKMIYFT